MQRDARGNEICVKRDSGSCAFGGEAERHVWERCKKELDRILGSGLE